MLNTSFWLIEITNYLDKAVACDPLSKNWIESFLSNMSNKSLAIHWFSFACVRLNYRGKRRETCLLSNNLQLLLGYHKACPGQRIYIILASSGSASGYPICILYMEKLKGSASRRHLIRCPLNQPYSLQKQQKLNIEIPKPGVLLHNWTLGSCS